jgi:hypothetical protein
MILPLLACDRFMDKIPCLESDTHLQARVSLFVGLLL